MFCYVLALTSPPILYRIDRNKHQLFEPAASNKADIYIYLSSAWVNLIGCRSPKDSCFQCLRERLQYIMV